MNFPGTNPEIIMQLAELRTRRESKRNLASDAIGFYTRCHTEAYNLKIDLDLALSGVQEHDDPEELSTELIAQSEAELAWLKTLVKYQLEISRLDSQIIRLENHNE